MAFSQTFTTTECEHLYRLESLTVHSRRHQLAAAARPGDIRSRADMILAADDRGVLRRKLAKLPDTKGS
jgi:hypothetical protein